MRIPSTTDFDLDVEGVGRFTFGRRKMRDELAIQVEYARIIDGTIPTGWLSNIAGWLAAFRILMVTAPEDFDIDEMDPADPGTYERMGRVYGRLKEEEARFRKGNSSKREDDSAGTEG